MSIFDTLFGISDANVNAAQIDAKHGRSAINSRSRIMGNQLGQQQYGLAASARGQSSPLALREAQRRSQMGQQAIGAEALTQEAQLQQDVARANQQAQMQANVANANIEMQNDQAFSRGLGGLIATGATAAMMMSDARAKEQVRPLYSDFATKEAPGGLTDPDSLRPKESGGFLSSLMSSDYFDKEPAEGESPLRPGPARAFPVAYRGPNEEGRAAFGLNIDRRPTNTLEQGAIERNTIDAIQNPGSRTAQYQSQMMRPGTQPEQLSNVAIARHLRERREAAEMGVDPDRSSMPFVRPSPWEAVRDFGQGLQSDRRSKEIAFQEGMRAGMRRSPMTPGYTHVPAPGYRPMPSDFRQKEMTADESRAALRPVMPVNYRYKPEASARMAMEQGTTPEERAMVFRDKRTPRDGIIAQDLLKSPAYRESVMDTPAGLAVERDRAISTTMAATAGQAKVNDEQDEELRALKRIVVSTLGREMRA